VRPVVVVVINEALYRSLQFSWQIVVLKQDLVFQGTVPAIRSYLGFVDALLGNFITRKLRKKVHLRPA
jgi:hypothetical protein